MSLQTPFNKEQAAAVTTKAKRVVVIAGPGSGKTRVLIGRVLHLITVCQVKKDQIVVITYTNAAAHVLTLRLKEHGVTVGYVGTLHGWCIRLIQKHGGMVGYRPGSVSIATEEIEQALLKETKKRLGSKISDKALVLKDSPEANLVWNDYRHTLKRSNMISYDQILWETHRLLCLPQIRELVEMHMAALLVDEAQDSAAIDWDCYDMMPAKWKFYVGDPDQAIFSFRGGCPEMLTRAPEDIDDTTTFILSTNYRSLPAICDAATSLIRNNPGRIKKDVVAFHRGNNGHAEQDNYANAEREIFGCFAAIEKEIGMDANEIAVLARTNALADRCRETLRGLGLPIKNTGKILLPADWGFTLSCLNLAMDPANEYHVEQVMKGRGDSQLEINKAKLEALSSRRPMQLEGFFEMNSDLGEMPSNLMLLGVSPDSIELVKQRIGLLPDGSTLADLVADLWKHQTWNREDDAPGITVTTIHNSKGKEWDMVIVIGCEEGILPSAQSIKAQPTLVSAVEADALIGTLGMTITPIDSSRSVVKSDRPIEEERRLLFVAMTRARNILILTRARERSAWGKTTEQVPSRFLAETRIPTI